MLKPSYFFLALISFVALMAYDHAWHSGDAFQVFVRFVGLCAFFLLSVSLMMGPAAVLMPKRFASLIEPRRSVGVAAFVFLLAHFALVFAGYFGMDLQKALSSQALVAGFAAAIIVLALALTSTDWAARKLGNGNWKLLHRSVYAGFVFAFYHSFMQIINFGLGKSGEMNLSQMAVLAIAMLAVLLQFAGAYTRLQRGAAAKAQEWQKQPNVPSEPST